MCSQIRRKELIHGCNHQADKRAAGSRLLTAWLLLYDGEGGAWHRGNLDWPEFLCSEGRGPKLTVLHRHLVPEHRLSTTHRRRLHVENRCSGTRCLCSTV